MTEVIFSLPTLKVRSLPGPDSILRRELANGIVVLARENFSSPSVVISGYLSAGSLGENRQEAGLAHLTAQSLMRGTKERSFNQIFESIESIGARLSLGASPHTTFLQGKALAEDLHVLLGLLSEVLRHPTFPKPQFMRLKGEQLTALAIRDQDTSARAQLAFDELAYGDHPYSLPTSGYKETISEISTTDIRNFHRMRYGPQGMVLVVVGAVEAQAAVAAVEEALGKWRNPRQGTNPELPPIGKPSGLLRRVVFLPGKSQCDIVLGTPGPSRFEEDYLAASLGNNILGRFGLYGRIGDAVRETAGLAYYAYSSISGGPGPGPWQVVAGVNPDGVEKTIDLIRTEIRKFVTKRVTKRELIDNQAHYIGRLPLQLESNEGVAGALLQVERYGLGLDYYQRYPNLITAISRDDIISAAERYLDPNCLAIAIAGPIGEEA